MALYAITWVNSSKPISTPSYLARPDLSGPVKIISNVTLMGYEDLFCEIVVALGRAGAA
jgi:hypothetical protein